MSLVRKLTVFLAALALAFTVEKGVAYSQVITASASPSSQSTDRCLEIIEAFVAVEDPLEDLQNPVLRTKGEVKDWINFYSEVLACLDEWGTQGEYSTLTFAVEQFLVLIGGNDHEVDLVDLETSDDRAVVKLREEVGLPPPEGYVYVNHFPSLLDTPPIVLESFLDFHTLGVTLPCRFIVVLDEHGFTDKEKKLSKKTLPETISHELVHAYFQAMRCEGDELPKWFREGAAVYFSGGKEHSITYSEGGREVILVASTPEEYQEYQTVFRYLRSELGEEDFNATIRGAVEGNSIEEIFQKTDTDSFEELSKEAQDWKKAEDRQKKLRNAAIALAVFFGLGVLAVLKQAIFGD